MLKTIPARLVKQEADAGSTVYIVTRHPGNLAGYADGSRIILAESLAPSAGLLAEKKALEEAGSWNRETFEQQFAPDFARELAARPEASRLLNEIYVRCRKGGNVCLACFCGKEETCHRSVLKGLLQAVGCPYEGEDYSPYFLYYQVEKKRLEREHR